jgi:hypothetical protein
VLTDFIGSFRRGGDDGGETSMKEYDASSPPP